MDENEVKLKLYTELFEGVNGYKLSEQARSKLSYKTQAHVYGEVLPDSFRKILDVVKPRGGEVFCDLGSGVGRPVFLASLFFPFSRLYGVEILRELNEQANLLLIKYRALRHKWALQSDARDIEFIHGNFLTYDFSDADVVFMNSTCFYDELFSSLIAQSHALKKGSRVITLTRKIQSPFFTFLSGGNYRMSWGDVEVSFYEKNI